MLPARLDAGHLPYASTYDHRTVVLWPVSLRIVRLELTTPGLDACGSAYAVLLIAWARSFFLPGGEDGFASLSADVNVPEKGEKKMVLATDTSKDALRCNQDWMLLSS